MVEVLPADVQELITYAIYIQIHHLPVELWDLESLELIANYFGKLMKIDNHTLSLSKGRYAHICVENNLS